MYNPNNNDNTDKGSKENEGNLDILYGKTELTKSGKFKNFLHYYKSAIIFASIALVLIILLTLQTISRTDPDLFVLYAGRYYLDGDSYKSIKNTLTDIMDEDYNGDGKITIELISQTVKTREQVEEEQEKSKQKEYIYSGDDGMESFRTEIMTGFSVICFLDEQIYDGIANEGRLAKLSDILGNKPEGAKDDFGIYLKDTPFANACPEFTQLSENTVVCFKKMIITNDEEEYSHHISAFYKLFAYSAPSTPTATVSGTAES